MLFGMACTVVIPFAWLCMLETRGRTSEEITPLSRFSSVQDHKQLVRGNLRSGDGMGGRAGGSAQKAAAYACRWSFFVWNLV